MSVLADDNQSGGFDDSANAAIGAAVDQLNSEMDNALAGAMSDGARTSESSKNSMFVKSEELPEEEATSPEVEAESLTEGADTEDDSEESEEGEETSDDEDAEESEDEAAVQFESWDETVTLPDGSTMSLKELYDESGRMRQEDYTRKTQALAIEKELILDLKDKLQGGAKEFESRMKWAQELETLRGRSSEFREELASLIEQHAGSREMMEAVKSDPQIQNMQAKLAEMERERDESRDQNRSREIRETFDRKFDESRAKYPHADKDVVESLIVSGKFDKLDQAMRHSHELVQSKIQVKQKESIAKKATSTKKRPPAPVKGRSTSVERTGKKEWDGGNILDPDWNSTMDTSIRESGASLIL